MAAPGNRPADSNYVTMYSAQNVQNALYYLSKSFQLYSRAGLCTGVKDYYSINLHSTVSTYIYQWRNNVCLQIFVIVISCYSVMKVMCILLYLFFQKYGFKFIHLTRAQKQQRFKTKFFRICRHIVPYMLSTKTYGVNPGQSGSIIVQSGMECIFPLIAAKIFTLTFS